MLSDLIDKVEHVFVPLPDVQALGLAGSVPSQRAAEPPAVAGAQTTTAK